MKKTILTGLLFTLILLHCSEIEHHITGHKQNIIINTCKDPLTGH